MRQVEQSLLEAETWKIFRDGALFSGINLLARWLVVRLLGRLIARSLGSPFVPLSM